MSLHPVSCTACAKPPLIRPVVVGDDGHGDQEKEPQEGLPQREGTHGAVFCVCVLGRGTWQGAVSQCKSTEARPLRPLITLFLAFHPAPPLPKDVRYT